MFLPVLLVRDLGAGAFLVFALPNVFGAAGMGWVLERQGLSEAWVAQHRRACAWFSVVTILFHIFFAGWIISMLLGAAGGVLAILLAGVLWALGRHRPGRDVSVAMVVYLISLACVALFLIYGSVALPGMAYRLPGAEWKSLWLIPVCFFGFGLCPYLDLTFHRARQNVDARGAKIAFGAGFGVFFFSMILFTLIYSGLLAERLDGEIIGVAGFIIGAHMVVQAGFTIAAHLRELMPASSGEGKRLGVLMAAAMGIVISIWWLLHGRERAGEIPYMLFLGFYGLVFPAYVWSVLVGRGRADMRILLAGIMIAGPMYYVGFVNRQTAWLLPGVAVALAAGSVAGRRKIRPA
jgi:hypothetical protein